MKVLILGDGDSIWTIGHIKNCIMPVTDNIAIYSDNPIIKHKDFYIKNGITCYQLFKILGGFLGSRYLYSRYLKWLRRIENFFFTRKLKKERYDIIIVQYASLWRTNLAIEVAEEYNPKIIYSYWGSDLLRAKEHELILMENNLEKADYIIFDSMNMADTFKKLYPKYDIKKIKVIWMGSEILVEIGKLQKSTGNIKEQLKKEWEIPANSIVIAIGYNGIPQQQHLSILKAIEELPIEMQKRIYLLFQMTYGGTNSYREQIIKRAKDLNIQYKILTRYLTDKDVAKIRIVTDVFVNGQTTDALSGTVRENLYCGNILINAGWLHYPELDKFEINYAEYDSFDRLSEVLYKVLDGEMQINIEANKRKVIKFCSWQLAGNEWKKILEGDY